MHIVSGGIDNKFVLSWPLLALLRERRMHTHCAEAQLTKTQGQVLTWRRLWLIYDESNGIDLLSISSILYARE